MFGVHDNYEKILLNHLLLIAKYQLYAIRYTNTKLTLNLFVQKVKEVLLIEHKFLTEKKFEAKWALLGSL